MMRGAMCRGSECRLGCDASVYTPFRWGIGQRWEDWKTGIPGKAGRLGQPQSEVPIFTSKQHGSSAASLIMRVRRVGQRLGHPQP